MSAPDPTLDPLGEAGQAPLELFRDFLDHSSDLVHATDADHRFLYVNRAWCQSLGYTPAEARALTLFDLIHPDHHETARANLDALRSEEAEPSHVERVLVTKSGALLLVESTISGRFEGGRFVGTRAFSRDVTEGRRAEDELRRSRDELREANAKLELASRAKDEFLASMSHELRTPLNGVLGLAEGLREEVYGPLNDRQQISLGRIEESGRHLLSLINDILDLAKVEAGMVTLEPSPLVPDDLVRHSLRIVQEAAQKKDLRVVTRFSVGMPAVLLDERRMKQVLVNLLSNAVKFTPSGGQIGVEVSVSEGGEALRFVVWDTGVGIPADDMSRLFRPFVQLDSRLAREHSGTGLGLALVRRIVDLHGGSVGLESEPGKGSRFTVLVPLRPAERSRGTTQRLAPTPRIEPRSPSTGPILLAEDDDINAGLVEDTLTTCGYEVVRARDGAEAVALARARRPALILMDMQMPEMDGLTAISAIRAEPDPGVRGVPILALTALAMAGDRERCLAVGADDYLSKPVSLRRLVTAIEEHLRAPR